MAGKDRRRKGAHERTIINLANVLRADSPEDDVFPNTTYKRRRRSINLRNNKIVYPDVVNFTRQIAYEVHWSGSRKEEHFDNLPDGWKGVNVFVTDTWESEEAYVFSLDSEGKYAHVSQDSWQPIPR